MNLNLKERAVLAAFLLHQRWSNGIGLRPLQFFNLSRVYQLVFPSPSHPANRNYTSVALTCHKLASAGLLVANKIDVEVAMPVHRGRSWPLEVITRPSHAFYPTEAGMLHALSQLNVHSLQRHQHNATRHSRYQRTTGRGVNPGEIIHLIAETDDEAKGLFLGLSYAQMRQGS